MDFGVLNLTQVMSPKFSGFGEDLSLKTSELMASGTAGAHF